MGERQEQKTKVASGFGTIKYMSNNSCGPKPLHRGKATKEVPDSPPPLKEPIPWSGPFIRLISGTVRCRDDFLILSSMREGPYLIHIPGTGAGF